MYNGLVAQLVRAPPCHGGGRRFESDLGRLQIRNSNDSLQWQLRQDFLICSKFCKERKTFLNPVKAALELVQENEVQKNHNFIQFLLEICYWLEYNSIVIFEDFT